MKTFTKFFKLIAIGAIITVGFNACSLVQTSSTVSAVSKENYDKIEENMTQEQVIQILGKPHRMMETKRIDIGRCEIWTYSGSEGNISIVIKNADGKVADKSWIGR